MVGLAIDPEAEPGRPATPRLGITTQLGTFFPLLPKQHVLVLSSEETVAAACRQLHERGLWSCLVRFADGAYRFFELQDLCSRLLDALHTDSLVARVVQVLGACSVGDLSQKEPVKPVLASTPLAEVLERLVGDHHEKVVVAGEGGEVERVFACSDLLELLLRYSRGSCHVFKEPIRKVLAADLEGEKGVETADPGTPVLQCFHTLREHRHGGLVIEDNSDPRQSLLERALGTVTMADVQYFFLRPAEEAARWASCSAREFVALEMRELLSPRAGAGAAHYPFIHADVEQSVEALVSKLLSSRAYCIALCSPSEGVLHGMVRACHVVRAIRSQLESVVFERSESSSEPVSSRSWPSPMAGPAKDPMLPPDEPPHAGALVRRVSWKDQNGGEASLASVHEFEMDGTPRKAGASMVLALEDGESGDAMKIPRPPNWQPVMSGTPQLPPFAPSPPSPGGSSAGNEQQLPHHHHILSVLALEDPALNEPLEPCEGSRWRQLGHGPEGNDACGPHSHRAGGPGTEQLQLVLYQKRELVLYDRNRNRAYARRLTEEQANLISCNQQSFCPLCRQRLNPSWAFVVEGYFEMLSAMVPSSAPAGSNFSSDEEAAAACGLHSIPASMLNSGYYSRFFVEERKLGSGSFGAVYLCRHVMDEIELGVFAVKKLALGDDTKRLRQVMREVKALERLRHMNIIDYKHSWLEVSRHSEFCPYVPFLFILMEFCNAGSLENLIWPEGFIRGASDNVSRYSVLAEELIWLLFLDVCRGLRHLHSRSILHRDLKPSNILLHVDDVANESASVNPQNTVPRAILSDFGTCEILGERSSVGGGHVHNAYAIEFSAPERLSGEESDEPADMWSAGLVLYAMAYGDLPYHSEDPQLCREKVMAHTVLSELPDWRDSALRGLISALTAKAPVARPTAEEAERVSAAACANRQQTPTSSSSGKASPHQLLPPAGLPLTLLDGSPRQGEVPSPPGMLRITSATSLDDDDGRAASDAGASSDAAEDSFMTSMTSLPSFGRASP